MHRTYGIIVHYLSQQSRYPPFDDLSLILKFNYTFQCWDLHFMLLLVLKESSIYGSLLFQVVVNSLVQSHGFVNNAERHTRAIPFGHSTHKKWPK